MEAQKWSGYRRAPIRSLIPAVLAAVPPGVQALTNAWDGRGTPWLNAPVQFDTLLLAMIVRGWIREHFQEALGTLVDDTLDRLDDRDWVWSKPVDTDLTVPPVSSLDSAVRYQLMPHVAAERFLQSPTVVFGGLHPDPEVPVTFYRVITEKGAELMSWPPILIPGEVYDRKTKTDRPNELGFASFVLRFVAQTIPGRAEPMLYHSLGLRRFGEEPFLIDGHPRKSLDSGVTALVGTPHRLFGGDSQPFTFVPMQLKFRHNEVFWPRALAPLLSENRRIPEPRAVALDPMWKWGPPGREVQAAIQYSTKQGPHGIGSGGVSHYDAAVIDDVLSQRPDLGFQRMGFLTRESDKLKKNRAIDYAPLIPRLDAERPLDKGDAKIDLTVDHRPDPRTDSTPQTVTTGKKRVLNTLETRRTPMLRAAVATPAVFNPAYSPLRRILILYRNPRTAELLSQEVQRSLQLAPSESPGIYRNQFGHVEVLQQYIEDDLWGYLRGIQGRGKERQRSRLQAVEDLSYRIAHSVPSVSEGGRYGALVEIVHRPGEIDIDPKLSWRIGLARAGYVNQHLHDIVVTIPGQDGVRSIEEQNRAVHAVADLWRQFGVLKTPLVEEGRNGGVLPWLVALWSVRRTQKTTTGQSLQGLVCARTNPYSGVIEVTTPALLLQGRWVPYHEMAQIFVREKWDQFEQEEAFLSRTELAGYTHFVFGAVRNCLQTPIRPGHLPRVLMMAEAHNVRRKLPWLNNKVITEGGLQSEFLRLFSPEEQDRVSVVRLRTAADEEVPVIVPPTRKGGSPQGLFRWDDLALERPIPLYMSIGRVPLTFSFPLKVGRSRSAEGKKEHRRSRPLEVAILHHPQSDSATVAHLVHQLRAVYPYYSSDSRLPLPVPFVELLIKEYAVSSADRPIPIAAEGSLGSAAD